MSSWIWSAQVAVGFGILAFLIVLVPVLIWQHRRYGTWSPQRMLLSAAVAVYGVALVTYTWLPLPDGGDDWCDAHAKHPQWRPLVMLRGLRSVFAAHGWEALTSFTFLQVALNVVLFIPWGVLMRRFFQRSIAFATVSGFAMSLFIEVTQGTGFWGLFPCAYRVADVDDLITNTTGAFIGALVAPLLLWWAPSARMLAHERSLPRPVTSWRRWVGQLIDAWLVTTLAFVGALTARLAWMLLGHDPAETPVSWSLLLGVIGPWLIVFVIPPWRHLAASPGQAAVWLTPMWRRGGVLAHGRWWQRMVRANVVGLPWMVAGCVEEAGVASLPLDGVWMLLAVVSVVSVPLTRTHRGLSGVIAGAEMVDIRTLGQGRPSPM